MGRSSQIYGGISMTSEQKKYKDVYVILDPIILANHEITHEEFEKEHPDAISLWSFRARKKRVLGEEGYGFKKPKKVEKETAKIGAVKRGKYKKRKAKRRYQRRVEIPKEIETQDTRFAHVTVNEIKKFVSEILPTSSNKIEYIRIAKVLVKEPMLAYSVLSERGAVTVSNPTYYQFRKNFTNHFNGEVTPKKASNGKRVKKKNGPSKKGLIYRTVYTNEDASEEIVEEQLKVFAELEEEMRMNLEVKELKTGYEIRQFTK